MNLFDIFQSRWKRMPRPEGEDLSAVDQVFKHLIGLVTDAAKSTQYIDEIRAARSAPHEMRERQLIRVYFDLEKVITSGTPPEKYATPERLRESVRAETDILALPKNLRLIFLPEAERAREISLFGVRSLLAYVARYGGEQRVAEILKESEGFAAVATASGHADGIPDFAEIEAHLETLPIETAPVALKTLYGAFFNEIRKSFGEVKAVDIAHRDYAFFKETYEPAFTSRFLDILPEGVLEIERLAFLSREELERQIKERTKALNELNAKLEEKVAERTKELTVANERLRELDQAKSEFVSVAAHQLRTPLSAVKWTLSLLVEENSENLTAAQKGLLLKGYEGNERTINLINEMLMVTRIESGKIQYRLVYIHIEDLIDSVLLDFSGQVKTHRKKLIFRKSKRQLPYVHADPEKIRDVIQNLIENALYYTKDEGEVLVGVAREGDTIRVSVRDNGIGIPTHQQAGIFNKFFRADNAMKTKADGSGLGLFVAKSIIDKHGGRIGFESAENVGTTFSFTLPVAKTAVEGE